MEKICEECSSHFYCKPSHASRARFCSKGCLGLFNARRLHATSDQWRPNLKPWVRVPKGVRVSPGSEFKPGTIPQNKLPVGSVTIRTDKNGTDRAFVKVADPNVWKLRAVIVWTSVHGEPPKGIIIHHKDRNALNDAPENLDGLTRSAHLKEHLADYQDSKRTRRSQKGLAL